MDANAVSRILYKICNSYQEIISDLDKSLEMIISLSDDEDILTIIAEVRKENVERLKAVQELIDILNNQYQLEMLDATKGYKTH